METLQELPLMEGTCKLKKECQECGIYDNASYASKRRLHICLLLSSAVAERDWRSFTAVDLTSVSPLPHHQFPRGLLQAVLNATELRTYGRSNTRDLSMPATVSVRGLDLLK